jgi:NAD(P)-dependent dehydrogenase (short-subunit alcohol dehydrogenase family)
MAERRAIVTGGSAGIGAEVCRQLLSAGYEVISLARRSGDIRDRRYTAIEVDLSDAVATRRVVFDLARDRPATTLIHNAGAVRERPLQQVTPEDLNALVALHLAAPIAMLQANLAAMQQEHYGRVVLVSTRAVLGLARRTVYSATKAGLLGLARTWALELGAEGITVNVVAPGPIGETEVFEHLVPKDSPKLPRIIESIPVQRLGRPGDVARAVLFFTAPEADFVTGQTLFVCGGTSVGSIVY